MAEGGVVSVARWIVLTPSADDAAWRAEIHRATVAAGLRLISHGSNDSPSDHADASAVILTEDAFVAKAAGAKDIVAILPEPESAPDAVQDARQLPRPQSMWHASELLARAAGLADAHAIVTAADLARRPASLRLFGTLELVPPRSVAEVSRHPAEAAAFALYRQRRDSPPQAVAWSEKLFDYDEKGSRERPEWGFLDVTGRPRMLVWGPYVALPPGLWRAAIRFGVDDHAAGHQYRVDWGTRTACLSEYVTPGQPGIYEIELDWRFLEAEPSEIRLILTEGSFMGTLIFQGMNVKRIADASNDAHQAS